MRSPWKGRSDSTPSTPDLELRGRGSGSRGVKLRVCGFGLRGVKLRVRGFGFRGVKLRVRGLGLRVEGSWVGVEG